jgi:hypothetical protein
MSINAGKLVAPAASLLGGGNLMETEDSLIK